MKDNIVLEKSFQFSIRVVNLYKYMTEEKKEYILSKQILRCGTSIGANATEAQKGQSKADFTAKMCIALKEAYESEYWIRLLYHTDYIEKNAYKSLKKDIEELISILASICKTAGENK
ncbi:MAG: four helix bundle protein [Oscillospiraceae bacterium]|nr:four helix bundle protein [Oscillospiraceae bacterium]